MFNNDQTVVKLPTRLRLKIRRLNEHELSLSSEICVSSWGNCGFETETAKHSFPCVANT